jgi:hypothetical protein
MSKFTFIIDEEAQAFCYKIAENMTSFFHISMDDAITRINQHWKGQTIVGNDIVYHEDPEFWAKAIYWDADS